MKKISLTLILLTFIICGAIAQNDAMYVYRNDGDFNAFLKSNVDSMTCSHYDVDSVYHTKWQMQVIYTPDSIFKIPLKAIDSISFNVPEIIPKITKFEQTSSKYFRNAFYNEDYYYDYKFEVAITVEIESLEGVADWGYAYKDEFDNVNHMSLMGNGTSNIDTNYAYYCNQSKDYVRLYGYVKYKGINEIRYGDPYRYKLEYRENQVEHTCPDSNHPHAIDLNLPSGTKWCCMNVGASSPEEYGGYYSWGETREKDRYGYYDYLYSSNIISNDIASTPNDVAKVCMGDSWKMPSVELQTEMLNNCTPTWAKMNGVKGILFIGKNGNQLFLPAAGCRNDTLLYGDGIHCGYWSSSPVFDNAEDANGIFFDNTESCTSYFDGCNVGDRKIGRSVRAVSP